MFRGNTAASSIAHEVEVIELSRVYDVRPVRELETSDNYFLRVTRIDGGATQVEAFASAARQPRIKSALRGCT
jgi:hypothetical protein